ncbi:MAG TPA: hypothetical protein DCR97_04605 [Deltaproteobacteria bacterium]|nr:hypothetical protein [Deltaproteobacteria bacterium]
MAKSRLYIDKRYFTGKAMKWVSFETSPNLQATRSDIYGRCVPCITSLYEQLKEGRKDIELGLAFSCWKVVVVLESMEECIRLLEEFERRFLDDRTLKGRFGSVDETKNTRVLVINATTERDRDRLYAELQECAKMINPTAPVFFHRGCAELYHAILGDWRRWKRREAIRKPEEIPALMDRIRKMLYWEKE